jgi:transcriptional regulator with XRE-family HTH domain
MTIEPPGPRRPRRESAQGTRLRALRERCGLTQAAVARQIGISPQAYAVMEARGWTSIDALEGLASAFGLSIETMAALRSGKITAEQAHYRTKEKSNV